MSGLNPSDLEAAASGAFREAGVPDPTADAAGRLAVAAICEHLMGLRVSFGRSQQQTYRDRAIYEMSRAGNSEALAVVEGLSARHVRRIASRARRRKGV